MDSNAPMNPDDRNGVLRDNHLVKSVKLDSPYDETSVSVRQTLGHIWTLSGFVDLRLIEETSSREDVFRIMKEEAKLKITLQRKRMNMIMYERLSNRRLGTHEIESIARKITNNRGNKYSRRSPWHKNEVVQLTNMRMKSLKMNIQMMERILKKNTRNRIQLLNKQYDKARTFVKLLRDFTAIDWKKNVDKCNDKIKHLEKVYGDKKVVNKEVSEIVKKVKVKDSEIVKWQKETATNTKENFVVYGDTILDNDEKAFINLPSDY